MLTIPETIRSHPLAWVISIAVAFRVAVFVGAMFWPLPNEGVGLVSPLISQTYADFHFYVESLKIYRETSFGDLLGEFVRFYNKPFENQVGHVIAGPVFPALMAVFDYKPGNTIPLATFYLVLECVWCAVWVRWFYKSGLNTFWLFVLALLPNPVWFMLIISPDLVFATLVGLFFVSYFSPSPTRVSAITWVACLLLMLLTRPNGYSLLLFVVLDQGWRCFRQSRAGSAPFYGAVALTVLFGLYLYPYFITELRKTAGTHVFFTIPIGTYLAGLFGILPRWLDIFLSLLSLAGAKVMYFVGLRPSYGGTPDLLVLMRALPGVVLLPGLVWGLIAVDWRKRVFLLFFFLPIFLGPTQDRYNLPVFPLLFGYGVLTYLWIWRRLISDVALLARR